MQVEPRKANLRGDQKIPHRQRGEREQDGEADVDLLGLHGGRIAQAFGWAFLERWNCILKRVIRPCFLVVDKQYPGSISTRKLVIETAMLNVLTAYSAEEAVATLERFPNVNGVVMDTEVPGLPCRELIQRLRAVRNLPIITVSPSGQDPCGGEEFHVSSYDPQDLLEQLSAVCPKETREKAEESHG